MKTARKWLVWVLVALMVGLQGTALAFEETPFEAAMLSGQEVQYTGSYIWHNPPVIDEETNSLLASLLGALTISGSYGIGDSVYHNMDVLISGESVLPMDVVISPEAAVAVQSPILGGTLGVRTASMYGGAVPSAEGVEAMANLVGEDFIATFQLEGFVEQIQAKVIDVMESAQRTYGVMPSVFGAKTREAQTFTVTKEDVMEVFALCLPDLLANTGYWEFILDMMGGDAMFAELGVSREDLLAQIAGMEGDLLYALDELIPERAKLVYSQCYDEAGIHNLSVITLSAMANYYVGREQELIRVEWVPGGSGVRILITGSGVRVDTVLEKTDTGYAAYVDVDESETNVFTGRLTYTAAESAEGEVYTREEKVTLDVNFQEQGWSGGFDIVFATRTEGIAQSAACTLSITDNGTQMPVLSAYSEEWIADADQVGSRIDLTAENIAYPAEMTEAEMTAWMESLQIAAMQTVLKIGGMLPPDVFAALMQQANIDGFGGMPMY